MSRLSALLGAVALCGCLLTLPAVAQDSGPPDAQQVQQSLSDLANRKLPAAEQAAAQESLQQTLKLLDQRDQYVKQLDDLRQQLAQAPQQTKDAQRQLARLRAEPIKPAEQRYAGATPQALEQRLSETSTALNNVQDDLNAANSLVINAQTRPERAQVDIANLQTRLQQIADLLKNGRENTKPLTTERRNQLLAEQAADTAQIQLLRQELAGNSVLQDLGSARRELYTEQVKRYEQETLDLQTLISGKRRQQSEKTLAEASRESEKTAGDDVLSQETKANLQLSDYLLRATDRLNDLNRRNLEARQQLDQLKQTSETMDQQIGVLKGSVLLSKLLYQQRAALPSVKVNKDLTDDIADLRLYQFELNQQRAQIANPNAYVDNLLAQQPPEKATPQLRQQLLDLLRTRADLQDKLNTELNALLSESIDLQLNQRQLQTTVTNLRSTLDEQMFWIPSNKPLDWSWLKSVPGKLLQQLRDVPWGSSLHELYVGLADRPLLLLPLVLAFATLIWQRRRIHARVARLNRDIGHYQRDSQLHTPLAILLTILLGLPTSLVLWVGGVALEGDERGVNAAIGAALLEIAAGWLVFYTVYRLLASGGVAETHFRWARPQAQSLRRLVRRVGLLALALMAVVAIAERQLAGLADDVLGILIVLFAYASLAWMLGRSLLNASARERLPFFRLLLGLMITAIPAVLFCAVLFGYYYTALKLTDRLVDTLYVLMAWIILEATLARGLSVAARRLAYQRALQKRQAQQEDAEGVEVVQEPVLDMDQVNQQSSRLLRLSLILAFLGVLYLVWADVVAVFSYLDNVTLYQYTSGTGATATEVPLTLRVFIIALVIAGLTVALARNLPGLLEVLVLSRLNLAQGSAYATTTLLSYVIVGVGTVTTLATLGVSWDKLQWLATALSVGLGFGLQEIFGNFISGLIILFERPVRVGDLITIGNVTGTVNKIRIRATHITDADRKSVVVPNKTFVTSQLINWTLTDTVTRIVLTLGINRGSDLAEAQRLIMQAVKENPRVLHDPEPSLYIIHYGASTLDHELRIYVRELGDRSAATDELIRRIDQLLRDAGINLLSTPQMEITLKNRHGAEKQLGKKSLLPEGDAQQEAEDPKPSKA
ncbi:potassium transporter KefA [Pseudomonas oryzihabitans]|nr:potassium transporter KefA [Pseudomonas psychrotolerans]KTT33557.1 potassium transporter KefA [Pseudomonas psychrotolerans]KTT43488.1 potassium transporter KefA [Pseudomonas psychrotolerans]KTT73205.1 potassium transporter KefA [Pseudomonas psychrotolerans]